MRQGVTCNCTLCHIELRLLSELSGTEAGVFHELTSTSESLHLYSSVSSLLSRLKASPSDDRSDELLRDLFAVRPLNTEFIESLLVLAFIPMMHGTIRRVTRQQPGLASEDITQQALSFLLQFLRSEDLRTRKSHFAFAISRAVKRQLFEWANRESRKSGLINNNGDGFALAAIEEPFERHALLRHFLSRSIANGSLTGAELNLLIQFKLEGGNERELSNAYSSNAVRQRLKRLLQKLRRLAQ
jgi:hypothetical protein